LVLSSWGDRAHVEKRAQAWLDTLEPVIETLRETLRGVEPGDLAARSGMNCDADGQFWLRYLGRDYRLTWPGLMAYPGDSDQPCPANLQGLFLYYLSHADGTPWVGRWVSFRELPAGGFYHQAFQGYTGNRLTKVFGNDLEAFRQAARELGGWRLDLGDAAFTFDALPRVILAVVYWQGDDEFAPNAQVLFDASVSGYLPTDACAVLGSQLVDRLIKQASAVQPAPSS
jgi:hypothetical protein